MNLRLVVTDTGRAGAITGDTDLRHNHAGAAKLNVMTDLHEVIDARAGADDGVAGRSSVDRRVGVRLAWAPMRQPGSISPRASTTAYGPISADASTRASEPISAEGWDPGRSAGTG
jgi:hypothetical protein